ncbi:hypothetical protein L3Q82_009851, partial [Scortum barcoo]
KMDSIESSDLERAEALTSTNTEPSQEMVHSSSLNGDISQLPATVIISSELVEDLLVQLMLRLNPLRSFIGSHLDQQQLLALCLHMSAATLETLRKVPGVSVDGNLPPPPCNTWKAAVLLQSSLMKRFGTSIQVRKQLVRKEPELLSFIPHHIIEAVLTTYKAESAVEPAPCQTPGDEELFSQFLPESVMEDMFEQHGSWIRHTKIFQRAFPRLTDQEVLEYQQRISEPRLSNRDVVWVDKKYFVADFYEEKTETDYSSLLRNLPTYDSGDHGLLSTPKESPKAPQLCLFQLMAGDCPAVGTDLLTDKALVKKSTIRCVLVELFKCRDRTSQTEGTSTNHSTRRTWPLKTTWWSISCSLVACKRRQRKAKKYGKNRVFLQKLKRLEDPKQELKLSREVCWPLKDKLYKALPNTWLSREGLMEDVQIALLACSLIAAEIINCLKPTVRFAANTKPGDETPYSLNIPIPREGKEAERDLTKLELRLQEQRARAREEVFSAEIVIEPQEPTKKKNKFFSWLSKLVRRRRT